MAVSRMFRCRACGCVVPLEQAFEPPTPTEQAKPKPCSCGATDWQPAKK